MWADCWDIYVYDYDAALERIHELEDGCERLNNPEFKHLKHPGWEFRAIPVGTVQASEKHLVEVMNKVWIPDPNKEPDPEEPEKSVWEQMRRKKE